MRELRRRDYERLERWRFECLLTDAPELGAKNALFIFESLLPNFAGNSIDCSVDGWRFKSQRHLASSHLPSFCYLCKSEGQDRNILSPYCTTCRHRLLRDCYPSSAYWWRYQCALK